MRYWVLPQSGIHVQKVCTKLCCVWAFSERERHRWLLICSCVQIHSPSTQFISSSGSLFSISYFFRTFFHLRVILELGYGGKNDEGSARSHQGGGRLAERCHAPCRRSWRRTRPESCGTRPSNDETSERTTWTSRSSSAGYATRTCTSFGRSGPSTTTFPWWRGMRS